MEEYLEIDNQRAEGSGDWSERAGVVTLSSPCFCASPLLLFGKCSTQASFNMATGHPLSTALGECYGLKCVPPEIHMAKP